MDLIVYRDNLTSIHKKIRAKNTFRFGTFTCSSESYIRHLLYLCIIKGSPAEVCKYIFRTVPHKNVQNREVWFK